MRIESSVTSISWIPSEVPTGLLQAGINLGLGHSDPPPPEVIEDLDALFAAERFRFANHLAAWIEVVDGAVVDAGTAAAATSPARGSAAGTESSSIRSH